MAKTVIFDFDGTLADSLEVIIGVFDRLTGKAANLSTAELAALRHLPLPVLARKLGIPMWQTPWLVARGRRLMKPHMAEIRPYAGITPAIKKLHNQGYNLMVVSSNSPQNVRLFLSAHDLTGYFSQIYGGVGLFSKTGSLRKILNRNRLTLDECVYVGDESRDVQACQALGLRCIAVEWGFASSKILKEHKPTAMAANPKNLYTLVDQLLTA